MDNNLAHSPADVVSRLLVALGIGDDPEAVDPTWPVFYSAEGDQPDNVVTVYDTQGTDEGSAHEEAQGHYGIQIRVRARDHATGWVKANEVFQALQVVYYSEVTIDLESYKVQCFARFGSILSLGRARNSTCVLFTQNVLVMVHSTTGDVPTESFYLVDQNGNRLVDQNGNYLLGA